MAETARIKVIIRKRPLTLRESKREESDILEQRSPYTIVVKEAKAKLDLTRYTEEHNFTFDAVFDETSGNKAVYEKTLKPLVTLAVQGFKVTCFAYGQTGSGKTYTTMGEAACASPGLFALAAKDLFRLIPADLSIYLSFYEIYCGRLYDLLNSRHLLRTCEDAHQAVNIIGLSKRSVSDLQSLLQLISYGMSVRMTGSTSANEASSRSHAILDIEIRTDAEEKGRLTFIDLAGSERGADVRDAGRQTRTDGAEINKSLLVLKECFRALDQEKKHKPFRGSKLTQVLKDSLVGRNCRTLMIGCVSPGAASCEHTLNTLRYADIVKEFKRKQCAVDFGPISTPRSVKFSDENCPPSVQLSKLCLSQDRNGKEQRHKHAALNAALLREEEELMQMHIDCACEDMEYMEVSTLLLEERSKPVSNRLQYSLDLNTVLEQWDLSISRLRSKLNRFRGHLLEERQPRLLTPSLYPPHVV